ncbi:uncharacterized protein LOC107404744 [Ziziphus jujuba]|uniref:Uncharacterized protein LOC107404744 n=1 Tax=Ziziphus jujuba TaxID=326968 RepID=A0ABM3I8F3_ZIZJJ|nr:uncharacterized protein LOC107404744 [Ziziphus jujuba]
MVLSELQSLWVSTKSFQPSQDINPFSLRESSNTANEPNHHQLKLFFPKFDGEDPQGWVYKAEQYFEFQGVPANQQVTLASFHLEGLALQWHRWFMKFRGPISWKEFTKAILLRFGPTEFEDPSEALTRLRQTTTVEAYQQNFEKLSHRIDRLPESFLIGCFIAGLRDDSRLDVKIKHPPTLTEAIGGNSTQGLLGPPPSQKSTPNITPTTLRRITPQEARERPEKGLCYYSDEKFVSGHRCAQPQLFMIGDDVETTEGNLEDMATEEPEGTTPEISFHAIAVLIDGGSTHNFIDQAVVTKYGLPVEKSKKFHVMVANKERIECAGLCHALTMKIQGCPVTADYYVLPVAACPIVLGVEWLDTLGPIETDYARLTMTFKQDGIIHTFQGVQQGLEVLSQKECQSSHGSVGLGTGFFLQLVATSATKKISTHPPELDRLLSKFPVVFQNPTTLPPQRSHDHRIQLMANNPPVNVRPYRYPHYQKAEIEKIVRELLQTGLIRPSHSPFSSPVLLVKKASGEWRFCVDYRALNSITSKDKYPIPVIDELLDELHGAQFFSKLDLRSGYHQIRVHEADIPKMAFWTHEGHYEFVVMSFGLTNAPATFQSLMNDIFRPYLWKFILIFFDDILVFSKSWEEHLIHLHTVLSILAANHLFAKESKCVFGVTTVEYLGHIISSAGVSADPVKVQNVREWPTPSTIREVRGFLGLARYYRKFIKHFGGIAAPLTKLLSKEGFHWTQECDVAFQQLKTALTTAPVLALPDFSQPFVIECDASGIGIGAVLSQNGRPFAYFS